MYAGDVADRARTVSYTHLRAHETVLDIVCRLLLEKKKKQTTNTNAKPSFYTDIQHITHSMHASDNNNVIL